MKFADKEHENFTEEKFIELEQTMKKDVYYKSLIYALGISHITRKHFIEIFNVKNGEIKKCIYT